MKKELKSSSRRKWVVGGIAFFGGLALITTGFATWIIGVQVTKANGATGVTVDSTSNESVNLTMVLADQNISVSENYTTPGKVTSNGDATDFKVEFSSISVAVSPSYLTKNTISNISFAFNYDATGVTDDKTDNNKITVSSDPVGRANNDYTYLDIDAASKIDLSSVGWNSIAEEGGFKTYNVPSSSLSISIFKWGTYFGGVSPCTYYNGLSISWTNEVTNAVTSQMKALQTAFNGGKIAISATLNNA